MSLVCPCVVRGVVVGVGGGDGVVGARPGPPDAH